MGIGGAMDLANGCQRLLVLMTHLSKKGDPKLLDQCNFPITAKKVVNRVITDMGVLDITDRGFKLVECAPDVSLEELRAATAANIHAD